MFGEMEIMLTTDTDPRIGFDNAGSVGGSDNAGANVAESRAAGLDVGGPGSTGERVGGPDSAGPDITGDIADLNDVGLTDRFRLLELQARQVEADMAAVVCEGQRRGVYADDSHLSMKGWLKANTNWSNSQVFRRRRLARLIEAFPTVGESLRDGHIGVAQVDEL
ncbi:MAG: hypothetical protein DRJ50_07810, partial [Actinobacteria bacterium]